MLNACALLAAASGSHEVIDFLAVLFGYAISGEPTLEAFYERLHPFASAFMALFGRERLPARSTLSRFLAALPPEPVEALRGLFLSDLLARPLAPEEQWAGLWDRTESQWFVFDIDGTREAASPRALPQTPDLPAPERRLRPLCAPGYTGRKRGEVVRSRTTILQAHTQQWLGSFSGAGNGRVAGGITPSRDPDPKVPHGPSDTSRTCEARGSTDNMALEPPSPIWLACRSSCAAKITRFFCEPRSSFGSLFPQINSSVARKVLSNVVSMTAPRWQWVQADSAVVLSWQPIPQGRRSLVWASSVMGSSTNCSRAILPQGAFTAADVVALYLHRGGFENALSDEDTEQQTDRWCSHAAWGQECWQIIVNACVIVAHPSFW